MLNFFKCRKVKSPTRAHPSDAGIDFAVPEDLPYETMVSKNLHWTWSACNQGFKREVDNIVTAFHVPPHERILIPSGIHVNFPEGYALIAHNKSGVATKKGYGIMACVVDHGYSAEMHLGLVNTSNQIQIINAGEKILQFILIKIGADQTEEMSSLEELYPEQTARGAGGFGSTGV